jgi:predicted house-cleaning noncanonical NTP pyrophosphatase (MazG superfamily)
MMEEQTGMKLTHHALICGSTNSGKSNTLMNLIKRCNGIFDKIIYCCQKEEPFTKMLKEKLKEQILFFINDKGMKDLPEVEELPEVSEKNNRYIMLIFDDMVGENQWTNKINKYFKM